MMMEAGFKFDFGYKIKHLSFGKDNDVRLIQKRFGDKVNVVHPLDGMQISAEAPVEGESIT